MNFSTDSSGKRCKTKIGGKLLLSYPQTSRFITFPHKPSQTICDGQWQARLEQVEAHSHRQQEVVSAYKAQWQARERQMEDVFLVHNMSIQWMANPRVQELTIHLMTCKLSAKQTYIGPDRKISQTDGWKLQGIPLETTNLWHTNQMEMTGICGHNSTPDKYHQQPTAKKVTLWQL